MVASMSPHHWTLDEFLLAWEAGAIGTRVELLEGEVWDVIMGPWHGEVAVNVCRALPNKRFRITMGSLASGDSLPLPDCTVLRREAVAVEQLSRRMFRWSAADVLLVVEVSHETVDYDLGRKSVMYARAGFEHYWTVTQHGVYVHTSPQTSGYANRVLIDPNGSVAVPYCADVALSVADLITI